jgi:flagellar FliJ protein
MAFRFSLETVLRLRRSQEDWERLRLQALFAQRAMLESQMQVAEETRTSLKAHELPSPRASPIPAAELQFVTVRRRACELESQRLRQTLVKLEQQIAAQTVVFVAASRARKVLEKLRERKLSRYQAEAQRKEQARVEEVALLMRAQSRRSQADVSDEAETLCGCKRDPGGQFVFAVEGPANE